MLVDFDSFANIFTFMQNNSTRTEIEIQNIAGGIIYKTTTTNQHTTIDISKQSKGIYFLRTTDSNKTISNKKIIIQ